jgi:hypothetical protein
VTRVRRWIAKKLCIWFGDLAIWLAPHAGMDLVIRVRSKARDHGPKARLVALPAVPPDIRVTCVHRGGEYVMGWLVRDAHTPEAAASVFCDRFIPEQHQQSRRAK